MLTTAGTEDSSLAMRLAATEAGLLGFLDRPVLGWGPENFGYIFDRHADPWVFRHGSIVHDKAHNQVLEKLTTKGIVGVLAFFSLWLVLLWATVRRARPAREDALAYAILGALGAYFVQNLFLFDTPSGLLVWLILVGWVAAQESGQVVSGTEKDTGTSRGMIALLLPRVQGSVSDNHVPYLGPVRGRYSPGGIAGTIPVFLQPSALPGWRPGLLGSPASQISPYRRDWPGLKRASAPSRPWPINPGS